MTDVPVLKMKEDVREDESKENNFAKAFATPSTVKRKTVRRSLGVFTTPTAYYQGLLTDFGSVYRRKGHSVFSTACKPSDYSLSENCCGKIAEDADKVNCSKITASGIVSESKRTNNVVNSSVDEHDLGKTMNSASNNLSFVTDEPDLLDADHQEFTSVSVTTRRWDDDVNASSSEAESYHDLGELQSECFDNVDVVSADGCKQDVVDQEVVVGILENSAQGSFRITPPKEVIIGSQHMEECEKINFDNCEFIKESTGTAHKPEFPQIKSDSNDMLKELSDTAQDIDKKHEYQEELTLEGTEREITAEVVKVGETVMGACQGSFTETVHKLEFPQIKSDMLKELSDTAQGVDKKHENQEELTLESTEREMTTEVVKVGETAMGACQGSFTETAHKPEFPSIKSDMLKELSDTAQDVDDRKHENQEELTLESTEREMTTEVVKVGETVVGACQGSLDVKDEDSQNTEDSGLFSLSSSIDVNDKIELGNNNDLNDILTCSLPEQDVHTMNAISTEEHLTDGESGKNEIISEDVSAKTTECSHFQNNLHHVTSEDFTCIVEEEKVDHGSSEVISTISLHQLVKEEKIGNTIHRDSSPDDHAVELCENTVVDLEVPHQNSLKCTGEIENDIISQDNVLSKAFQPDSYDTTNIDQGVSTSIVDVDLNLFNENVGKRKRKDTNKKGRRKSIRLQMRDVNSHYGNCVPGNLAQINEADVADAVTTNNTKGDCISGDIDSLSKIAVGIECKDEQEMSCKIKTNPKSKRSLSVESATGLIEGESLSQPELKELITPIQNIKQNCSKRNSRRPRKKKNKKKSKSEISPDTNHVVNVPTVITVETKEFVNNSQSTTPDAAMIQQCTTDIDATTISMQSPTCRIVQPRKTVGHPRKNKTIVLVKPVASVTSSDTVSNLQETATVTSIDTGSNSQETCMFSSTFSPKEIPDTASNLQETCMSSGTYSPKEIPDTASNLQETCMSSGTYSPKEIPDTASNLQETCMSSGTYSPKEIPDTASNLQETCMSSGTYSPKAIQTVDSLSLQDGNILNEFDGLDDLDIFKEVTETNINEKTKNRRTQKRTIGREKNTRRRSARLAGIPVLDNIFYGEQHIEESNNACTSSASLEIFNEISEKTEETSVSQRKIRKLKRTSFGKPLMLLNMFGTIPEPMNDVDETCDSESFGTAEVDQTDSATAPQHVTEDICRTNSPEESSTVFNGDVPKDLLDICDEQNSYATAFATHELSGANILMDSELTSSVTAIGNIDLSGDDVLADSESNSAGVCSGDGPLINSESVSTLGEEQPAKRSSRRTKQIIQPISKPKQKKEPSEKEMSPVEIEQFYINRGSCSKVIKANLLETIFETSCQPNAVPVINIGKKKLNRKMTFQSPWLPRKRSNKKKGKRLIVKTRKFKISNQLIVDKLDDVLCDLDAFETLLYQ